MHHHPSGNKQLPSSRNNLNPHIFFTVTNDLSLDQRMIRICTSVSKMGYQVTLVGRKIKNSRSLVPRNFNQKRLRCLFTSGKAFYVEYNIRLFFFLLSRRMEAVCAIDLDTILPCYLASRIKNIKRIYDAHELFCEMKEIVTRPSIYAVWKKLESFAVPQFTYGYTVSAEISKEFTSMYNVEYPVIANMPVFRPLVIPLKETKYILYQGSVNEGRSFETLIPAMKGVNIPLIVCGDGNFMESARELVKLHRLEDKVIFKGKIEPDSLREITRNAWIGVTLFENKGLSNYFSLANRFFDYIHAGIPQLCIDFPSYREINNQYEVALLIKNTNSDLIIEGFNALLNNEELYKRLQENCLNARKVYNWESEELKLSDIYEQVFNTESK